MLLFLLALAVHYVLLAFEAAAQAERRQLELQILTRDAELRALRAQIDPHFLFNSLNSISALTTADAAGARRMCLLLGGFPARHAAMSARASGSRSPTSSRWPSGFSRIEQVRFGERLQVERGVEKAPARCLVPPLLLQPLVENAVTHGIARMLDGGTDPARRAAAERSTRDRDR